MLHLTLDRQTDLRVREFFLQKFSRVKDVIRHARVRFICPNAVVIDVESRSVDERAPRCTLTLLHETLDIDITVRSLQPPFQVIPIVRFGCFEMRIDKRKRECAGRREAGL